jgi:tetratricopeptide (TPR) repeat protein
MDDAVLETGSMRQLMNELLAIEPRRRQEAVREERYRSLLLAEMLAKESGQFEEACPAKAEELAELARMVADQPYPGSVFARVDRVLAVSHCLQGNARRLSGDRPGAEQQFRRAAAVLTGPPDAVERALYCQRLAWLREEQGRFEEATTLLWRAVGIFREARSTEGQVECLCRLGFLLLHGNDPNGASRHFAQARGLLAFESAPALAARCALGLALCLAAAGQEEPARSLRKESRRLCEAAADSRALLDLDWLEGRLAAAFGEHQEAIAGLASVRRRLVARSRLLDAALCSLDLARLFAATGQAARVRELIHEMQTAFPPSRDQARVLLALRGFLDAVRAGQGPETPETAGMEALDLIRRPAAFLDKD